jgi:hypothetical protein
MSEQAAGKSEPEYSAPSCDRCDGGAMKLVRSSPGVASLPELRTYRCAHCGHVETVETIEAR